MKVLFTFSIISFLPLIMIFMGYMDIYHYPRRNWFVGYRTNMSMINDDTWSYANSECGKKMYKAGLFTLPISILITVLVFLIQGYVTENVAMYIGLSQVAVMIIVVILTEIDLNKTFNKDGSRKDIL